MKQWHPVFAQLLRPALERYYEVRTTVAVGDAPREADFVLVRRTSRRRAPFQGIWRYLTVWNVLEFKGPTVSPRRRDLGLLVELGLGIERRLRREARGVALPDEQVSFWYLANRLGERFRREAVRLLGDLEPLGPGLWRARVLRHPIFLVSGVDLPVEAESLPIHVVAREPPELERAVAQLVATAPDLLELYGGWVASLHSAAWKEVERMAQTKGKKLLFDVRPAIESLGLKRVIEQVGLKRVIEAVGPKEVLEQMGPKWVIEQMGLKWVIEQMGPKWVIEQMGQRELVRELGLDDILANLSPAERRELKRRLE